MKKLVLLLIIFLLTFSIVLAEEGYLIQGIVFKGIKNVPYDVIQNLLNIKVFNSYTKEYIEKEVERLRNSGYFKSINYELRKLDVGYELLLVVEEFPVINKIILPDTKIISQEEIKNILFSKEKSFFNEKKALEDCDRIRRLYEKKGYVLKENPSFYFKNNTLVFEWREAPPIGRIEFKTQSQWVESLIKSYLKLSIGDYIDLNKLNELNIFLSKMNIKIKLIPSWEFRDSYTILYLDVVSLPPRDLTFEYEYNNYINFAFGFFADDWGYWKISLISDLKENMVYGLEWRRSNFYLNITNREILLSFRKRLSEIFNVDGELGVKENFVNKDRVLLFSFIQDHLLEEGNIIKSGKYVKFGLDFHGGGSVYNYSLLYFLGKYYISYGEGLGNRILGIEGDVRYPLGYSPEKGYLGLKVSYTIPLENKIYLNLGIGGDSNFLPEDISSVSDLKFSLFGSFGLSYTYGSLSYNIRLESNFVDVLKFFIITKFNF